MPTTGKPTKLYIFRNANARQLLSGHRTIHLRGTIEHLGVDRWPAHGWLTDMHIAAYRSLCRLLTAHKILT